MIPTSHCRHVHARMTADRIREVIRRRGIRARSPPRCGSRAPGARTCASLRADVPLRRTGVEPNEADGTAPTPATTCRPVADFLRTERPQPDAQEQDPTMRAQARGPVEGVETRGIEPLTPALQRR